MAQKTEVLLIHEIQYSKAISRPLLKREGGKWNDLEAEDVDEAVRQGDEEDVEPRRKQQLRHRRFNYGLPTLNIPSSI